MGDKDQAKTRPTTVSVRDFLHAITDMQQQADAERLRSLMEKITGQPAVMWGPSIVGFGQYHYKYASGREGDGPAVGFAPRKTELSIYIVDGLDRYAALLEKLGPHKRGKGCLYVKRLSDVDMSVLEELVRTSYRYVMAHKDDMGRAE